MLYSSKCCRVARRKTDREANRQTDEQTLNKILQVIHHQGGKSNKTNKSTNSISGPLIQDKHKQCIHKLRKMFTYILNWMDGQMDECPYLKYIFICLSNGFIVLQSHLPRLWIRAGQCNQYKQVFSIAHAQCACAVKHPALCIDVNCAKVND